MLQHVLLALGYTAPVLIGFLLDLVFGDPGFLIHPVQIIGKLITILEHVLRPRFPKTKRGEHLAGMVLVILVFLVGLLVPAILLFGIYCISKPVGILVESFFCYQILATKSLKEESGKVYDALTGEGTPEENLLAGRKAVSRIVGRDTENLSEEGVIKAAVETVAENTSDGVIAPLFYMMIGGATFGFAYKAVNTMDSMIGYKNEQYQYFGTAAAKLDDVVNFLPARIAALLMIFASKICGMDAQNAKKIWKRDRKNHKSPNAAQTEAVMAGALGIQLAGDAWYFGELYEKPTIGDPLREITAEDILYSHFLLYVTAGIALLCALLLRFVLLLLLL